MPPPPRDSGRVCAACGYNLTGSDSPSCPECGADVQLAEAARLEGRAIWDLALSLIVPPGLIGVVACLPLSRWGRWSDAAYAVLLALAVAVVINNFRVAWHWLADPGDSRARRAATAAWFTLCLSVVQALIAVVSGVVTMLLGA